MGERDAKLTLFSPRLASSYSHTALTCEYRLASLGLTEGRTKLQRAQMHILHVRLTSGTFTTAPAILPLQQLAPQIQDTVAQANLFANICSLVSRQKGQLDAHCIDDHRLP